MENIEQRISSVINDREHGSRWLVHEAVVILRDLAESSMSSTEEQMHLLYRSGERLAHARPAMAALSSAVGRILSVDGGPSVIAEAAQRSLQEYDQTPALIARHAQAFIHGRLLTCSISGTVLEVFRLQRQQIEQVTVLEGRPRYEGREMARALQALDIPVTLITDAQADIFLPQCERVVVGADSILANGDLLNKAGTALLAWAAKGHNIPFYALCETLKISPQRWYEDEPAQLAHNLALLEEKEPEEVLAESWPGVTVRNFYFDRTPYRLISKIVTEQGSLDRRAIRDIALQTQEQEQLLMRQPSGERI